MDLESFFIGLFCGAYGMFTLLGFLWCSKKKQVGNETVTVNTDGIEQDGL